MKTLPPVANPTRSSVIRPHKYVRGNELERNYDQDAAGALDRGPHSASASLVNPSDSPEAHQPIIDMQARLIVASQKQLIERQSRVLRRLARENEALLYSREPSAVAVSRRSEPPRHSCP